MDELSSDHNPIVLLVGPETPNFDTYEVQRTNWTNFRSRLQEILPSFKPITNIDELEEAAGSLEDTIKLVMTETTNVKTRIAGQCHVIPTRIRELIHQRRKSKNKYQRSLDPDEKRRLNRLNRDVKKEFDDFHSDR